MLSFLPNPTSFYHLHFETAPWPFTALPLFFCTRSGFSATHRNTERGSSRLHPTHSTATLTLTTSHPGRRLETPLSQHRPRSAAVTRTLPARTYAVFLQYFTVMQNSPNQEPHLRGGLVRLTPERDCKNKAGQIKDFQPHQSSRVQPFRRCEFRSLSQEQKERFPRISMTAPSPGQRQRTGCPCGKEVCWKQKEEEEW